MNVCFTSDKRKTRDAVLSTVTSFREIFHSPPNDIDVLVLEGDCNVLPFADHNIDTCIFQSVNNLKIKELKNVNSAISCGMQGLDSVTFSSISEDEALVCIRRRIVFCGRCYDPCEFKVPFDKKLGIYLNLVVSLLFYLSEKQGEENEEI